MNESAKITQCLDGLVDIQRHLVGLGGHRKSLGERIHESEKLAQLQSGRIESAKFEKKSVLGTGALADPLAASYKPAIDPGTRRPLQIRDLLTERVTRNAAIELPVKTGSTDSAAIQNREGVALGESDYTFTNTFYPCQTIGHTLQSSKQILDDAAQLDAFIHGELLHGLGLKIQDQLLNGDATNSQLYGLLDNATAYSLRSPNLTAPSDILRDAIRQVQAADFAANAIVLHPSDWYDIDVQKAGSGDDAYVGGAPRSLTEPKLWGLPVVVTNAIASGTFLVADFGRCAALFQREESITISNHHADNFKKGMITIKAYERLSLAILNATAMVTGSL